MLPMLLKLAKWSSIPILLMGAMFSGYAASYQLAADLAICLGAVILVQYAVRSKEYFWATGFVVIVVVFSPLLLVVKIFLLIGLTCIAAFGTLLAAFRTQPVAAL
jgi:hypothetical protein